MTLHKIFVCAACKNHFRKKEKMHAVSITPLDMYCHWHHGKYDNVNIMYEPFVPFKGIFFKKKCTRIVLPQTIQISVNHWHRRHKNRVRIIEHIQMALACQLGSPGDCLMKKNVTSCLLKHLSVLWKTIFYTHYRLIDSNLWLHNTVID
jgi:hypothetical protein